MIRDSVDAQIHERIWGLVPWFVSGRLSNEDALQVEAHIVTCEVCRDECALQAQIHDAIRDENSVAFASEASYRKLADRIEVSGHRKYLGGRPLVPLLAAALALESVALIAWGSWAWLRQDTAPASYVTLSSAEEAAPVAEGSLVHVVFASQSTLENVQNLLQSIDGRLVDGPTASGVYTISLRSARGSKGRRLEALRGSAWVRFAEPVFNGTDWAP